jgi:hypothetical protein
VVRWAKDKKELRLGWVQLWMKLSEPLCNDLLHFFDVAGEEMIGAWNEREPSCGRDIGSEAGYERVPLCFCAVLIVGALNQELGLGAQA